MRRSDVDVTYEGEQTSPRNTQKRGGRWEWLVSTCCLWVLVILMVLFLLALSISKLAMGVIYFSDCPVQNQIPVYLIISACAVLTLIGFYKLMPEEGETKLFEEKLNVGTIIALIGVLFIFVWLICGTVWTLDVYSFVLGGCDSMTVCCDRDLIQYSLAIVIIDWIFVCVAIVTITVTAVLVYCTSFCRN